MNTVRHLPEQQTFVLSKNNQEAGRLKYEISDGLWNITHTVVDSAFRGEGLARILVDAAAAEAAKRRVGLKADCSYAATVLAQSGHKAV